MAKPFGLVGIMSVRRPGIRPFAEGGYFCELMAAGRRLGLRVIAFSPLDIDWSRRQVYGFTYHRGIGWRSAYYPIPTVIYDRLFPGKGSWQAYWRAAGRLRRLRRVRFMGKGLHGKWQMYRIVRRDEQLSRYLPETHRAYNFSVIAAMLHKYSVIFLKPMFGSGGTGIIRVSRSRTGYIVRGKHGTGRYKLNVPSVAGLRVALSGINSRYLVQQGLKLNYLHGSTYDVRVIAQKNGQGKWQVSGMAARIGRKGSITSNLHTGGIARTVESIVKQCFPEQADQIIEQINEMAIGIADLMDRKAGPVCDLGLDLGIDVTGRIWLIEVNSKPGRKVFRWTRDRAARRRSVQTPMEYARFLLEQDRGR